MKVTVEIDQKWVTMARSPIYFIVSALTGVSVTFAPLFLYWSGKGKFFPGYERITVPLCFFGDLFRFRFLFLSGYCRSQGIAAKFKVIPYNMVRSWPAVRFKGL
jgi:hypothetical protein